MNYTEKYHLPQWEESDRILMKDFNQAMSNIENGLNGAVQHGSSAAESAANNAVALAEQAQAAAEAALNAANAAQAAADKAFRPGYLPHKAGIYDGTGGTITIEMGFRPSCVLIDCGDTWLMAGQHPSALLQMTSSGMTILPTPSGATMNINRPGFSYDYIAFQ